MQVLPIFVHYGVLTRFGGVRKINCYLSVADSRSKNVHGKGIWIIPDITVKNAVSLIFCEYKVNAFFAKGRKYRFRILRMGLFSIFRYIRHAAHLLDIR